MSNALHLAGSISETLGNKNPSIPVLTINDRHIVNMNGSIETSSSSLETSTSTSTTTLSAAATAAAAGTSTSKKDEIFSASNIFDLIHGVQINCECSPLDKENSHFIIADMAIAAVELIKTSATATATATQQPKQRIQINKSASIHIDKDKSYTRQTFIRNIESLDDFSAFSSPLTNQNIVTKNTSRKRTQSLGANLNGIVSLRSDASTSSKINSNHHKQMPSFVLFENSIDLSTDVSSSFTSGSSPFSQNERTSTSRLLKFSSPTRQDNSKQALEKSKTLGNIINRNRTDQHFSSSTNEIDDDNTLTRSSQLHHTKTSAKMETIRETSDSSGVGSVNTNNLNVNSGNKPTTLMRMESQRSRKFSWEEIDDMFSAENIGTRLLRQCLNRLSHKSVKTPTLLDLEFFIRFMEYYEYLQTYYESKMFARARRMAYGSPSSGATSPKSALTMSSHSSSAAAAMSASSIYLSHSQGPVLINSSSNDLSVSPSLLETTLTASTDTTSSGLASLFGSKYKSSLDSSATSSYGSSSSFKVKSAALVLGNQTWLDQLEKQCSDLTLRNNDSDWRSSLMNASTATTASSSFSSTTNAALSSGRIIGDELWAPVREQLILNLHPKHKRAEQMQSQHYRCADCGIRVRADKIKTFLYCEYFGKYFCRCCHIAQQSYIPAYVVYLSDYRVTFEVSKKAKSFLEKIYNEPLITLESLNPNLFRDEASVFVKMKRLRAKLYNCRSYLNSCRFSAEIKTSLESQFDDFIINDQHVYSIQTLFRLRKSNYYEQFKAAVSRVIDHIRSCELCSQQGYICGYCNKPDLLYPFEFETVEKCPNCLACYHKACFKSPDTCPRCMRKKQRAIKQSS